MYQELNLALSDEQIALKEAAHKFAREVLRPASVVLDQLPDPAQVIEKDSILWHVLRKAYGLGYHSAHIPEAHGGLGLDPLSLAILNEELGWGSLGLALTIGAASFTPLFGSMSGEKRIIDEFTLPFTGDREGKFIGCWGITEPDHGSDALMPGTAQFRDPGISFQVRATREGDFYVLNGQKSSWISNGTIATHCTLFCTLDPAAGMKGGGICLVPLDLPGVSRGKPLKKLGSRDLNQGEIFFEDVRIPREFMICEPENYEVVTDATLASANAAVAIMYLGAGRAAFEEALRYATERIQGGKPLVEHQLIRAKLFDMFMNLEAARSLARTAMVYNSTNVPPSIEYSIASKVFCTQTAFRCASEGVQILGSNGLSQEYLMEKLFRDTRAGMIADGANEILGQTAAEKLVASYDFDI